MHRNALFFGDRLMMIVVTHWLDLSETCGHLISFNTSTPQRKKKLILKRH